MSTTWQIAKLQENNRALDRLTKTKEAALLEAERTIEAAEAKASLVDDLQNRNQELLKRIEICQVLELIGSFQSGPTPCSLTVVYLKVFVMCCKG